uniref:Uncharacterized protein n=1 Tax=Panagrellus redivivus TaxID=6233 RepID=A0A7E4VNQ5_PANRE
MDLSLKRDRKHERQGPDRFCTLGARHLGVESGLRFAWVSKNGIKGAGISSNPSFDYCLHDGPLRPTVLDLLSVDDALDPSPTVKEEVTIDLGSSLPVPASTRLNEAITSSDLAGTDADDYDKCEEGVVYSKEAAMLDSTVDAFGATGRGFNEDGSKEATDAASRSPGGRCDRRPITEDSPIAADIEEERSTMMKTMLVFFSTFFTSFNFQFQNPKVLLRRHLPRPAILLPSFRSLALFL